MNRVIFTAFNQIDLVEVLDRKENAFYLHRGIGFIQLTFFKYDLFLYRTEQK